MVYLTNPPYSFLNAKISAIKSKMLKRQDFESLVSLETIDQVIDKLEKTYYRENLQRDSVYLKGSELIESSSYKWIVSVYKKLIPYISGKDKELIDIFINRHEIRNLKVLLSARAREKDWDSVEPLIFPISDIIDYKRFYDTDFKTILKTVDIGKQLLNLKLSTLWRGKEKVMEELIKSNREDILILSSLELYYAYYLEKYLKPHSNLKPIKMLLEEQDVKNISLLLRIKEQQGEESELINNFLIGGTLSLQKLLKAFKDENYLKSLIKEFNANPTEDVYKIEFDMYINIAKNKRSCRYKFLTLERILGFLLYMESEAELLRFIARAKEMGIEKSITMEMIL